MLLGYLFRDQCGTIVAGPFWRSPPEGQVSPPVAAGVASAPSTGGLALGGGASAPAAPARTTESAAAPHRIPEAFLTANLLDGPAFDRPSFENGDELSDL